MRGDNQLGFTPGPWEATGNNKEMFIIGGTTVIGTFNPPSENPDYKDIAIKEMVANSSLTAAAPDMVEKLIKIYKAAEKNNLLELFGEISTIPDVLDRATHKRWRNA